MTLTADELAAIRDSLDNSAAFGLLPEPVARDLLDTIDALQVRLGRNAEERAALSTAYDASVNAAMAQVDALTAERDEIKATYTQCDLELWMERDEARARVDALRTVGGGMSANENEIRDPGDRWSDARAEWTAAESASVLASAHIASQHFVAALDAIDAVLALHGPIRSIIFRTGTGCSECHQVWPCPTAAALGVSE